MISHLNSSSRFSTHLLFRFFSTHQSLILHKPPYPPQQSYMELTQNFYDSMKECSLLRSVPIARKLHSQLVVSGLDSSTFIQNQMIDMYSKCGLVDDAFRVFDKILFRNVFTWNTMINGYLDSGEIRKAENLFDEMPERDIVSWNSMMSGYFRNGMTVESVNVLVFLIRDGLCVPDRYSFSCVVKACGSLGCVMWAMQLHALVVKFGFSGDVSIESSLVDMYIKCGSLGFAEQVFLMMRNPNLFSWNCMIYGYSKLYGAERALCLFEKMPEHDGISWNTMISILSKCGDGVKTLNMFIQMCSQDFRPNSMTYASVLSACTDIYDLFWGAHLHARIVRMEPNLDVYMGCGLIDMYAKCGSLESARRVFNNLKEHNAVSWTSLIGGVARFGNETEALELFKKMKEVPVASDQFTLANVLGVCCSLRDLFLGQQIHAYSISIGIDSSVPVANALVTMYAKCGDIQSANHKFEHMSVRDVISWTSMITAFSHTGNVKKAREYFDKMPERNVISWNSMVATYVQYGFWEEGLKVYVLMQREGIKPDWITFTSSISACAYAAVLKLGNQLISQAEKLGFSSDVSVTNSVITMYSRCGHIKEARRTFDSIVTKNLISWNAIMAGYAQSGLGREVIEVFEKMSTEGISPDHISYISVLSGCSHSGMVPQGQHYFNMMTKEHGISPTSEHFACMVDLLGRAGHIDQAKNLIDEMPFEPNASVWGALLGACRIHGKTTLAETALKNLMGLNVEKSGSYVLLANMYSDTGNLECHSDVRKLMREKGIRKNPGCSWIEVDNRVHVFTVDDTSHPRVMEIYGMLEEVIKKIEGTGMYVKELGAVKPRDFHSEKLAVAFGLLSLPAWIPIQIMKNLRICDDCHLVIKLVSLVASRELIVRDANRFHHFKDGSCSCRDYW